MKRLFIMAIIFSVTGMLTYIEPFKATDYSVCIGNLTSCGLTSYTFNGNLTVNWIFAQNTNLSISGNTYYAGYPYIILNGTNYFLINETKINNTIKANIIPFWIDLNGNITSNYSINNGNVYISNNLNILNNIMGSGGYSSNNSLSFGNGSIANGSNSLSIGTNNYATADNSGILSGGRNRIFESAVYSVITGGVDNNVTGVYSGILAGQYNLAQGVVSLINSGSGSINSGGYAIIGGGWNNIIGWNTGQNSFNTGNWAETISGGRNNNCGSSYCVIGGGYQNKAGLSIPDGGHYGFNNYATVSGGFSNYAYISGCFIGGGEHNICGDTSGFGNGWDSVISGGYNNQALSSYSVISGGKNNIASASMSVVLGGRDNTASGDYSISGGQNVIASGINSIALGHTITNNKDDSLLIGFSKNNVIVNNSGIWANQYMANDSTLGYTGSCTILGLTSINVKNGLIVGCT